MLASARRTDYADQGTFNFGLTVLSGAADPVSNGEARVGEIADAISPEGVCNYSEPGVVD